MYQKYKKSNLLFSASFLDFSNIRGLNLCRNWLKSAKNHRILTNFGLITENQYFNQKWSNALLNNNAHFVTMIVTDSLKKGGVW